MRSRLKSGFPNPIRHFWTLTFDMIFNSFQFIWLFPLIFIVYWIASLTNTPPIGIGELPTQRF